MSVGMPVRFIGPGEKSVFGLPHEHAAADVVDRSRSGRGPPCWICSA